MRIGRSASLLAAFLLVATAGPAMAQKSANTLRWATNVPLPSPDPYYNEFRESLLINAQLIFDSLVYRDPSTGTYEPLLATSWTWRDTTTLDFTLRKGVKFHDGRAFTADDVVYTVNYVADPGHKTNVQSNVNWMKSAEKLGDYAVRLHLNGAFPAALEYLAGPISILPVDFYGKNGAASQKGNMIGTGPYRFVSFAGGKGESLEINKDYWAASPKGRPTIARIEMQLIPDMATEIAQLMAGELDWIWYVPRDQAEKLEETKQFTVAFEPTMRISYLAFEAAGRGGKTPLADLRVRRAISYAVDRKAIAEKLIGKGSSVVDSACYPKQFGCSTDVKTYDYDPQKAKALLAEAGYPNGFDVEIYAYRQRQWIEAVDSYLSAVGIRPHLNYMAYAPVRKKVMQGEVSILDGSWGSYSINDASAILNAFFTLSPDDMARDQEVAGWLKEAGNTVDQEQRKTLFHKALARIADQAYWLPLYVNPVAYVYSPELDFRSWPDENPRFYLTQWKP
jgi:peptide/nickel transport system substrate-binding protein